MKTKSIVKAKRAKASTKSLSESAWTALNNETGQDYSLRQPTIKWIQDAFGCRVYSFFTSFDPRIRKKARGICDTDAEMLENVLLSEHDGKRMLLVINSPGGDGLAAERIANMCRAYSKGKFSVLVPHMAKSAATLIAFGADKIYMSRTSELGPVDPQVGYVDDTEQDRYISAAEYVRAYDNLMKTGISPDTAHVEPILQQLVRFDPRDIEQLRSAQKMSESISIKLLETGMMKVVRTKNIEAARDEIKKKIEPFLIQEKKSSHGRMIDYDEAKSCGLNVELVDLSCELWSKVWELYLRADWFVGNRSAAILETPLSAVSRFI